MDKNKAPQKSSQETMNAQIINALKTITKISNDKKNSISQKLQQILLAIVECMNTEKGSVMLLKGRKNLEVMASTDNNLIGIKQPVNENSPSGWVVKNKKPLWSGDPKIKGLFKKKGGRYKKQAFIIAPIFSYNKIIGVINVTERMGKDQFTKAEIETLLDIGSFIIGSVELNRLTESLKESKQRLSKQNKKLKELERIRTELFNMLIHDLKGPISEIMANLDILTYTTDGENKSYVESAGTACDTLYRMISDLLDIARLEEGSLKVIKERIVPNDLISETLSRLHGLAKIKNLDVRDVSPAENRQQVVIGDRGILLRVLQNLLSNAIHHSPKGEKIEAGFQFQDNGHAEFFIRDNGPGVGIDFQEAIFDKFFQLSKKNDGRTYSTGLGLTFCKLAVEAHHGTIRVESDGKKGSCFKFTIGLDA